MKRSKEEAEVIVRLDFLDKLAHVCVNQWPAMAARFTKKWGKPIESGRFVARWRVPLKAISFRTLSRIDSVKSRPVPSGLSRKRQEKTSVHP